MMDTEIARVLTWDSGFFGLNIGRVNPSRLDPEIMPRILEWCVARQIDCLYLLADCDHDQTIQLAATHLFHLVDIRVTLEQRRPSGAGPVTCSGAGGIRAVQPADLPALRDMAGRLHEDTRFFSDPNFPRTRSRELYSLWIEKSCANPLGQVFVADWEGTPAGYIACSYSEQQGQIDLVGVEGRAQDRGLGQALVATSLDWLATREIRQVTVVTQGRNVRAQRLYQRAGFVTQSVQLWYHLWPHPGGRGLQTQPTHEAFRY
jgi:ribosomal protein S18 acetylase RimI-like enzyme